MNEPRNIEDLLQSGFFTTSRAKTPKPSNTEPPAVPPHVTIATRNYNPYTEVPRSFDAPLRTSRRRNYPPKPSVEDETESLLKEHGSVVAASDDDPPSRGDAEQHPIIMEVHEYNPERRFVIVPKSSSEKGDGDSSDDAKSRSSDGSRSAKSRANGDYAANTTRKYKSSRLDDQDKSERPPLEKRKSRQDLPRIETDIRAEEPRTRRHERTKSGTRVEQEPADYFSSPYDKRQPKETLLSPQVIKHATGGREKVYYDYSQASRNGAPRPQRSHSNLADQRRFDDNYTRHTSSNPPGARRSNTNVESAKDPRDSSGERLNESARYQRERPVPRGERPEKKDPSPPYEPVDRDRDRDRQSKRTPTYKRDSPRRRDDSGSSSSDYSHTPRTANARRRRSFVRQEGRDVLLSPEQARPSPSVRSRSRAPAEAVGPSPRVSAKSLAEDLPLAPRASQTFPIVKDPRESGDVREKTTPYPEDDFLPSTSRLTIRDPDPTARARSRSRASTFNNTVVVPAVMPSMPVPAGPRSPNEKRRSPERRPIMQPATIVPPAEAWPPAKFDPAKNALAVDGPRGSYRRYSHDADRGGVPDFPECPRKNGVVGYTDWLSLPRCDNFNICPDCYNGVFLNTEFRNSFMPMLFRPMDKPIACDFGSCGWYHIAWLLTLKNRHTDLRLFYQVANVASKVTGSSQPCPGDRRVTRVWYSLRDPYTQTTMQSFTVCFQCAKTVEGLLPNLTGVFVTLHPTAQPTRGTCAMHFNPDRKRFVMYFDALETTSDVALATAQAPNIAKLVKDIESLSGYTECRKDNPVFDQNWHVMQFIPQFTVCGDCFDEVVAPHLKDGNAIARNFYVKPQRLEDATCQLYSARMRAIFDKACRRNDVNYLESKVMERQQMFIDTYRRLQELEQEGSVWAKEEGKQSLQNWARYE